MLRRAILGLLAALLLVAGWGGAVVRAQGGPDAYTAYDLNLRTGPDVSYPVLSILPPGAGLMLEARNADAAWLLVRTPDGAQRGWVASLYLTYAEGVTAARLPVSEEIIAPPPAPVQDAAGATPGAAPAGGSLADWPVMPVIGPRVYEIYQRGLAIGNDPRVFTQVGECNSLAPTFMWPFGAGVYNLGPYSSLQAAIDFFSVPVDGAPNSFLHKGVAMTTGLTSQAVINPVFTDITRCPPGLSLLECEYTRTRPAVALIHLGLYDVYWMTPRQYENAMRRIIDISIEYGVIPVLTAFPTCAGDVGSWPNDAATRIQYRADFNAILVSLATEYGVPLMNLWRATQPLPSCGLNGSDHQHLSQDAANQSTWASFNGGENTWGFTMWNLVALQTLDQLRQNVLGG